MADDRQVYIGVKALLEEIALARLIEQLRPYLLSSPPPRRLAEPVPTVRIPAQRSRTGAEAEQRLFLPHRYPSDRLRRIERETG